MQADQLIDYRSADPPVVEPANKLNAAALYPANA
jgi:hypothetical protein